MPVHPLLQTTVDHLTDHGFRPTVVASPAEALAFIQRTIPAGASVMNGTSRTLEQIGFVEYLKQGAHPWKNLHAEILAAKDPVQQAALRQGALHADWYLGSVHALTATGEALIASNTGSQLPHLAFTSPHIILVVGWQKIVTDLTAAWQRLSDTVIPQEDARIEALYGVHTVHAKTLILHRENPRLGRDVQILIVTSDLGF